jgi:hypothetical protein
LYQVLLSWPIQKCIFPTILPDTVKSNMDLKVLIDAREMLRDRDSESLQFSLIADT